MKRALLVLGGSVYCLAMGVLLAPIALALLGVVIWFMLLLLHIADSSNPLTDPLALITQSMQR